MSKLYTDHPVIAFHPEQLKAVLTAIIMSAGPLITVEIALQDATDILKRLELEDV